MAIKRILNNIGSSLMPKNRERSDKDQEYLFDGNINYFTLSVDELQEIIKSGIDLDQIDEMHRTLLMYLSSCNDDPEVIKMLIEAGTDVNEVDYEGSNALIMAVKDNYNEEIIEVLIKSGIDVNWRDMKNRTALMYAARYNTNPDIIECLLKHGADGTLRDYKRFTAFEHLKKSYNLELRKTKAFKMLKAAAQ